MLFRSAVELVRGLRLPAIFPFGDIARDGGLIAYGVSVSESNFRAAYYVDRLLRGAKVEMLPFEMPRSFELLVNLRAAKEIGLAIPESFLVRADEVIE